jgi:hypothetical protein
VKYLFFRIGSSPISIMITEIQSFQTKERDRGTNKEPIARLPATNLHHVRGDSKSLSPPRNPRGNRPDQTDIRGFREDLLLQSSTNKRKVSPQSSCVNISIYILKQLKTFLTRIGPALPSRRTRLSTNFRADRVENQKKSQFGEHFCQKHGVCT